MKHHKTLAKGFAVMVIAFLGVLCLLTARAMATGGSSGWGESKTDDDDRSSFVTANTLLTESTLGGVRREGHWSTVPDLSPKDREGLKEFTYLVKPGEHVVHEKGHPVRDYLMYNTYPFDLPASDIETGTLHLSRARPFTNADGTLVDSVQYALRSGVNQIIITDSPDFKSLKTLGKESDDEMESNKKTYGFHFFGGAAEELLKTLEEVLSAWDRRYAVCKHLDFAFTSGDEGFMDFSVSVQRRGFITALGEILRSPLGESIESLSLRFMQLDGDDLERLKGSLIATPKPKFKRLIMSFNNLSDDVMKKEGPLSKIIKDVNNLPLLQVIDVKGNAFRDTREWKVDKSFGLRKKKLRKEELKPWFDLSYHGFSRDEMDRSSGLFTVLRIFSRLDQPEGYTPQDSAALRSLYNGNMPAGVDFEVKPHWIIKAPSYADIADLLLVLRRGKFSRTFGGFQFLNLKDRALTTEQVFLFLAHGVREGGHHPFQVLDLRGAYRDPVSPADSKRDHKAIANTLGFFPGLFRLSLSNNRGLGPYAFYYGGVIDALENLKTFTFSATSFGSNNSDEILKSLQDHFDDADIDSHTSIGILDYGKNQLGDKDIEYAIRMMEDNETLQWISFKDNAISLNTDSLKKNILKLLELEKLKYLDLSGNPIKEKDMTDLIKFYKDKINAPEEGARTDWPVLVIDGEKADATRTPVEYVSDTKGFLSMARFYDTPRDERDEKGEEELRDDKEAGDDHRLSMFEEKPDPEKFYLLWLRPAISEKIEAVLGTMERIDTHNLEGLDGPEEADRQVARSFEGKKTDEEIKNFATVLKHMKQHASTLTRDQKIGLLKALPQVEQKRLIREGFNYLIHRQRTLPRGEDDLNLGQEALDYVFTVLEKPLG